MGCGGPRRGEAPPSVVLSQAAEQTGDGKPRARATRVEAPGADRGDLYAQW